MQTVVLFFILSFVGSGLTVTVCPSYPGTTCDLNQLRCCDLQFQSFLGLSNCTGAFYSEPYCHQQQLENVYSMGVAGAFAVCSSFTKYYNCLGGSVQSCTSTKFHVQNGLDLPSALTLSSIYTQFGFACGAGLEAYTNNANCMSSVFGNNSAEIANCRSTFSNNINADWNQRCSYYSEFDGCFQTQFQPCGMEAGWWGCEYARQGARTWLSDCYMQCSASLQISPSK